MATFRDDFPETNFAIKLASRSEIQSNRAFVLHQLALKEGGNLIKLSYGSLWRSSEPAPHTAMNFLAKAKELREHLTPALTTSAFLERGVLTPEEFVAAGAPPRGRKRRFSRILLLLSSAPPPRGGAPRRRAEGRARAETSNVRNRKKLRRPREFFARVAHSGPSRPVAAAWSRLPAERSWRRDLRVRGRGDAESGRARGGRAGWERARRVGCRGDAGKVRGRPRRGRDRGGPAASSRTADVGPLRRSRRRRLLGISTRQPRRRRGPLRTRPRRCAFSPARENHPSRMSQATSSSSNPPRGPGRRATRRRPRRTCPPINSSS